MHRRKFATSPRLSLGDLDQKACRIGEAPRALRGTWLRVHAAAFQFRLGFHRVVVLHGERELVAVRPAVAAGRTQHEHVLPESQQALIGFVLELSLITLSAGPRHPGAALFGRVRAGNSQCQSLSPDSTRRLELRYSGSELNSRDMPRVETKYDSYHQATTVEEDQSIAPGGLKLGRKEA